LWQRESAVIPHGHYREAYPSAIDKLRARMALGLRPEQTVLLFFGGVAPYKNVPHLIATFRQADLPETIMLVAGRPDCKHGRAVEMAAQGDPRIRLDLRHIPKEEARLLFSAADLVVLPFSDIMHSGSAILALSFNKPVLVPALGALPELQACVGKKWVQTYQGELTPAILSAAAAWARNSDRAKRPDLSSFEWPHIVQATVALYSRLCAQPLPLQQSDKGTETLAPAVLLNQLPPAARLIFKDPV
jgi:beta-1,4-mannosyltransferase